MEPETVEDVIRKECERADAIRAALIAARRSRQRPLAERIVERIIADSRCSYVPLDEVTYFIRSGKFVKVGSSTTDNMKNRLTGLQCANPEPLKVLLIANLREFQVHEALDAFHYRGEWFRYNATLRQVVDHLSKAKGIDIGHACGLNKPPVE